MGLQSPGGLAGRIERDYSGSFKEARFGESNFSVSSEEGQPTVCEKLLKCQQVEPRANLETLDDHSEGSVSLNGYYDTLGINTDIDLPVPHKVEIV
mmetsp:Transcript_35134/g.53877  ORF Transcript_35134/g.53877 Transcript_35134/m.53877 type:complete len:96 (+) Transcript_35134:2582-2869(+)